MIRWICGISMKDRGTNEELRRLVGVEHITTVIGSGRLRWYGHVMRKGDEDWVKKYMEYRVEGRRPVGRPRRTWLESVEADIAEFEIDKEDIHDRKKAPNDTDYTRWSCDSGLANPVQIVSNPPAPRNGSPITFFCQTGHDDPLDGWQGPHKSRRCRD